jgi:hypothetical protein
MGDCVSMIFTDVGLAGKIDGLELAYFARQCYPDINVIVTSGRALTRSLPEGGDIHAEAMARARRAARGPAFTALTSHRIGGFRAGPRKWYPAVALPQRAGPGFAPPSTIPRRGRDHLLHPRFDRLA